MRFGSCIVSLLLLHESAAQSTIAPSDDKVHAANAGWIGLRPSESEGVQVTETYLAGKAYAANFGWINLGDGSPVNGFRYGNDSRTDFGVNMSADGLLEGRAYSANVGWITFEQVWGLPRLDLSSGKFSGFAYSANVGWIALDPISADLITTSIAHPDSDGDGVADAFEFTHFGDLHTASATSDSDGDRQSDLAEYLANTSPVDPGDFLSFSVTGGNADGSGITFEFTGGPGRLFVLQDSESLLPGSWGTAKTYPPSAAPRDIADSYTFPSSASRFFRLMVASPLQP